MSTQRSPQPTDNVQVLPAAEAPRHRSGFWAVAFAFLIVMAFATLPSPLYGLYRMRDDLSAFTVTVIYAIFAAGTIATLLSVRFIAARARTPRRDARRRGDDDVGGGVLAAWKALPGLLIGRLITGVAVGLAAGTAITYLIELRVRADPNASVVRARNIGTAINVGALGIGPLIAGCLAEWARLPLTLPYLLWVALGAVALVGLAAAPETAGPVRPAPAASPARSSSRSVRLLVPAALATLDSLLGERAVRRAVRAVPGHDVSPALPRAGRRDAVPGVHRGRGVAAGDDGLPASRVFVLGTISMLVGLALLVTSVRLSTPSLALFLLGGVLIGGGAGAVFKGTTGLVLEATAPENRLAMTSDLLIALFVGLSIPVIGAGVALDQGASPPDTVLGFAIVVGLGVAGAGALLARALRSARSAVHIDSEGAT